MAVQMQVLPPANGGHNPIQVGSRSYAGTPGTFLSVPFQDGLYMTANGWVTNCINGCGSTSDRPPPNSIGVPIGLPGITFLDTTIDALILWDGANWRHTMTGAIV